MTNFLLEDVDGLYKMYGYYQHYGTLGTNYLISALRGPTNVVFKDGQHLRFGFPSWKLHGIVMNDRVIEPTGSCTFEDLTNNRKCVLVMSTLKTSGWVTKTKTGSRDEFEGIIYDSKEEMTGDKESVKKLYSKDCTFVSDIKNIKDVKR